MQRMASIRASAATYLQQESKCRGPATLNDGITDEWAGAPTSLRSARPPMFFQRLEEARRETKSSTPQSVPRACITTVAAAPPASGAGTEVRKNDSDEAPIGEPILERVSDWLSDVWDANCMKEFKLIEDFESKACIAFEGPDDGYTLEQKKLHEEFVVLFESLISQYLREEGFSTERFYDEVRHAKQEASNTRKANEIIDVVTMVVDFAAWAQEMRSQAQHRKKWEARRK